MKKSIYKSKNSISISSDSILKKIKYCSFIIAIVLLFSCVTVKQIPQAEHTHIIKNIPFYPQETYQCGPATLAMVLNYWGMNITPDDIAKEIFSKAARGTLNIDTVLFAQRKGLTSIQYKGNLDDLKNNIDSGNPVIVLVDYGFSLYEKNHFMVIVGYNEHGVIVNSGRNKEKFINEEDFLKTWGKTNYWTLLIKK